MTLFAILLVPTLAGLPAQGGPGPIGGARAEITVEDTAGFFDSADIAYDPDEDRYVSVYLGPTAPGSMEFVLRAVTVDPVTGTLGAPVSIENAAHTPSISWNPAAQRFLVAYVAKGGTTTWQVRGCLLDVAGTSISVSPTFLISPNAGGEFTTCPRSACDGDEWLVVWEGDDVRGRVLSGEGSSVGSEFYIPTSSTPTAAYSAGPHYLLVYRSWAGTRFSVVGRTVDSTGTLGEVRTHLPDLAHANAVESGMAAICAIPSTGEFLVGWVQHEKETDSVYRGLPLVWRVDATGAAASSPGVVDGYPPETPRYAMPGTLALAWNSRAEQVMAVWNEGSALWGARLNPYDLSVLEADIPIATPVDTYLYYMGPRTAIASRDPDTQVIVQWSIWPGLDYSEVRALRYGLGEIDPRPSVKQAAQLDLLNGDPIPWGAATIHRGFVVTAQGYSYRRLDVTLELEVLDLTDGSTISLPAGPLPSNSSTTFTIDDLPRTHGYRWRLRASDASGTSDWTSFGEVPEAEPQVRIRGNTPPTGVADQIDPADATSIPIGTQVATLAVRLAVAIDDLDRDDVFVEFEIQSAEAPFTGQPTWAGVWVRSGEEGAIEVGLPPGPYHWQYRLTDPTTESEGWITFGGNPDEDLDFRLLPFGSVNSTCAGSAAAPSGSLGAAWVAGCLALALSLARRGA